MYKDVAGVDEILPGGMKAYEINGVEIILLNDNGRFYAFDRKCGHMGAPLEMGTANGLIVTCPLHGVQFEASTGKALSGPLIKYLGEPLKLPDDASRWLILLIEKARTNNIRTFSVRVEGNRISVDV